MTTLIYKGRSAIQADRLTDVKEVYSNHQAIFRAQSSSVGNYPASQPVSGVTVYSHLLSHTLYIILRHRQGRRGQERQIDITRTFTVTEIVQPGSRQQQKNTLPSGFWETRVT